MRSLLRVFLVLLVGGLVAAQSFAANITALRSWRAPDNTRLVLDLTGPVKYRISPDSTPAHLVVEIDDVQIAGPLSLPAAVAPLKALHFEKSGSGQRLLIDTTSELTPKIFQLPPNEKYGHRLVLDLYEKPLTPVNAAAEKMPAEKTVASSVPLPSEVTGKPAEEKTDTTKKAEPKTEAVTAASSSTARVMTGKVDEKTPAEKTLSETVSDLPVAKPMLPPTPEKPTSLVQEKQAASVKENAPEKFDPKRYRNIIVAIDAGHGGEDPGASGAHGTHEKNVTLAIARELESQLQAAPGITAMLTRSGDYFIPLQDRRRIARYEHKADIFVSIHADAAESRSAHGASVFALSLKGAGTATSRFARMLAERENRSDLIGGASIESEDDILRNVLADMVVAGSLEHSLHMGRNILTGLERIGSVHSSHVEQAGFAVLKEPGMVSLLVETGFISNPEEEKKLNEKQYQQKIARAVFDGVRRYCMQYPAPGTYFAWLAEKGRDRPAEKIERVAETNSSVNEEISAQESAAVEKSIVRKPAKPKFMKHKVVRGESLTRLAAQYQVSMSELREANRLRSDNVRIGQVLKIPLN